jgi:hypothetical protein
VNHLSLFGDFTPRFHSDRGLFLDPGDQSRPEWPGQGKERSVPPDPLQRCRKLLRHVRDRPTSDSWPVVADVTAPQALPRDQGAVLAWLKSSSSRAVTCRTRAEHLPFRSPTVRRVVGPCVKLWCPPTLETRLCCHGYLHGVCVSKARTRRKQIPRCGDHSCRTWGTSTQIDTQPRDIHIRTGGESLVFVWAPLHMLCMAGIPGCSPSQLPHLLPQLPPAFQPSPTDGPPRFYDKIIYS